MKLSHAMVAVVLAGITVVSPVAGLAISALSLLAFFAWRGYRRDAVFALGVLLAATVFLRHSNIAFVTTVRRGIGDSAYTLAGQLVIVASLLLMGVLAIGLASVSRRAQFREAVRLGLRKLPVYRVHLILAAVGLLLAVIYRNNPLFTVSHATYMVQPVAILALSILVGRLVTRTSDLERLAQVTLLCFLVGGVVNFVVAAGVLRTIDSAAGVPYLAIGIIYGLARFRFGIGRPMVNLALSAVSVLILLASVKRALYVAIALLMFVVVVQDLFDRHRPRIFQSSRQLTGFVAGTIGLVTILFGVVVSQWEQVQMVAEDAIVIEGVIARFDQFGGNQLGYREAESRQALQTLTDRHELSWIWGRGFAADYDVTFAQIYNTNERFIHVEPVFMVFRHGIVGAALYYLALLVTFLWLMHRRNDNWLMWSAYAFFIVMFIQSLSQTWFSPDVVIPALAGWGLMLARRQTPPPAAEPSELAPALPSP